MPGAVDTKSGGPVSITVGGGAAATGAAAEARRGTGTTDSSVGVPAASGAIGRTGRHITTVVVCAAAFETGTGVVRFARFTTGRRAVVATFLGWVLAATFLVAAGLWATGLRRVAAGAFLGGAATGLHSTSESTEAFFATACCEAGALLSRTTWPLAELAADRVTTIKDVNVRTKN